MEGAMTMRTKILPAVRGAAVIAATALLLGGCGSTRFADWSKEQGWPVEDWRHVPPRKEPKASLSQMVHKVRFAAGSAKLSLGERQRLDAFLHQMKIAKGDQVLVQGAAAGDGYDERRQAAVGAFLEAMGVQAFAAPAATGVTVSDPDTVAVLVRRYTMMLPRCPDWSADPSVTYDNLVNSNFGCATATNFGLMVADPADLVEGRPEGTASADYMTKSIERYRVGKTRELTIINTGSTYKTESKN
jgi:pilus biogenesis lipoprotein CpaD